MEFEAHFTHDAVSDLKFRIEFLAGKMSLKLSTVQYEAFTNLTMMLRAYFAEEEEFDRKRKYFVNRPLYSVKEKANGAKAWWKYAIRTICSINRARASEVGGELYRRKYIAVFMKEYMKIEGVSELDKTIHDKAIFIHDLKAICKWTEEAVYQIEKDIQEEKNKKPSGLLGGLFSWGAAKKEVKEEPKESAEDKFKRLYQLAIQGFHNKNIEDFLIPHFSVELNIETVNTEFYTLTESIRGMVRKIRMEIKSVKNKIEGNLRVGDVKLSGVRLCDNETVDIMRTVGNENCFAVDCAYSDVDKEVKVLVKFVSFLIIP